jgi:hypothetical protein
MVRPRKPITPGPLGETEGLRPSSRSFVKGRYATTTPHPPAADDDGAAPDLPPTSKYLARATAAPPPDTSAEPPSPPREPAPVTPEPDDPSISFTIDLSAAENDEEERSTYYQRHRADLPRLGIEPADREEDPPGPPLRWALLRRNRNRD